MRKIGCAALFICFIATLTAQTPGKREGIKDDRKYLVHALVNALVVHPDKPSQPECTILIQNGKILKVGKNIPIPSDAVVIDLHGRRVYPAFIELNSEYGLEQQISGGAGANRSSNPEYERNDGKSAWGWNRAIKPNQQATTGFKHQKEAAEKLRKQGFGAVQSHYQDGIIRGRGALIALSANRDEATSLLNPQAGSFLSFDKGSSSQQYPSSQMGAMALMRQTFLDLEWYQKAKSPVPHLYLDVLKSCMVLPLFFSSPDKFTSVRAINLANEFNYKLTILGSGDEYQNLQEIVATQAQWVIPINFPKTPDMADPWVAGQINLRDLKHWELAPYNFKILTDAGLTVAISGKETENIFESLEKIHQTGIDEMTILKALTTTPAAMVKMDHRLGKIAPGFTANLIITSGPITEKKTRVLESWILGDRHPDKDLKEISLKGTWVLDFEDSQDTLIFKDKNQFEVRIVGDTTKSAKGKYLYKDNALALSYEKNEQIIALKAELQTPQKASNVRVGTGSAPKAAALLFVSEEAAISENASDNTEADLDYRSLMTFPFQAYGKAAVPEAQDVHFKNATIWTLEGEGICAPCDLQISKGKIVAVGPNLPVRKGFEEVDATGKHISPGMIDEHSHIGISRGVNESGSSISAEVRIGDVINPEDINIYRQLAGGTTMSQLLHGSANTIGGQSALVKLRWGMTASEYPIVDAPGFIKFALGENVKQSNWGDRMTVRYPQSRMGVEQFLYESFFRAIAYRDARKADKLTRIDLELEALVEILEGRRFISCHSYVQSEINMLMKVADSLGFTVNTFTHILEGYKVADKMKRHGAHASTFSDWWAYKMEVNEAIPFNAAILWKMGITTAINSDDAEMGRRLNQEAAKVLRYGEDIPETEALKTVTLNPAKMLHLDHRLGSISKGKDADIVVWDAPPLQTYAKVEKTFVDGRLLFDREKHNEEVVALRAERQRLMKKALQAASGGAQTAIPESEVDNEFHCDTLEEFHYHGH